MKKKFFTIQELCIIGLATALICVIAPLSIPMPLGVPITLQTFIITIGAIILGAKRGAVATFIYILLGAFGLPVFSNFTGGWQMIVGPTGGFILSFPIMAYVIGRTSALRAKHKCLLILGMFLGTVINFVCGVAMFCLVTESSLLIGFTTCVLPFIPLTIIKWILAYIIGINIRKRIQLTDN
jgi:biotin transport system substrate-specific component